MNVANWAATASSIFAVCGCIYPYVDPALAPPTVRAW